jgi:hypothetical protein
MIMETTTMIWKQMHMLNRQAHVILPPGMDRLVVSALQVMLQAMKQQEYFAELVNVGIRQRNPKNFPEIVEIHSRKSQDNRNKASDKFLLRNHVPFCSLPTFRHEVSTILESRLSFSLG